MNSALGTGIATNLLAAIGLVDVAELAPAHQDLLQRRQLRLLAAAHREASVTVSALISPTITCGASSVGTSTKPFSKAFGV